MANICIVAHFAYGAIAGGRSGHAGGVERQTSLMARWLAERGNKVSILTWDEGQADEVSIDGVRVIKMCRKDAGLPGVRFFYPRWSSLNRAMRKADADLYYQNCAEYVTGQVALWCHRNGRRFVYSVASDPECDPELPEMRTFRERILYRYGLRRANKIIVQTQNQKSMLKGEWDLESTVLPMPCEGPIGNEFRAPMPPVKSNCRVAWIGRISPVKRLEFLLDIAEAIPKVEFHIAGKPDKDDVYSRDVLHRARNLLNVIEHGMIQKDNMRELYKNVSLLCCTSQYEGFPNTFLEAWSYGIPVISTVDPDDLIADRELGIFANGKKQIIEEIQNLIQSPVAWRKMSSNAREYYLQNHAVDSSMSRFEKLFSNVIGKVKP